MFLFYVLTQNLKTAWLAQISMSLLSSFNNLLKMHTYAIFQESVDYFEIETKTRLFLVTGAVHP